MSKTLFDHLNAVFTSTDDSYYDKLSDADKKSFTVYLINRGVSMNPDYVQMANVPNRYWGELSAREVFLLYRNVLPRNKQYNKWIKSNTRLSSKYEDWVMYFLTEHFELGNREVLDIINVLASTDDGIETLNSILRGYGIEEKKIKKLKW